MKIALLTIWHTPNYGAELQTYATVRKLQEMNHSVCVIDYRLHDIPRRISLHGRFLDFLHNCSPVSLKFRYFWNKFIPSTRYYATLEELRTNPPQADLYLVGSDQVWNPQITKEKAAVFFLDFAPAESSLASYASSMGTDTWLGDEDLTVLVQKQLKKFVGISCREMQGCKLLGDVFHVESTHVLDPTLLHTSYPELTGKIKHKNTLAYYQLSDSSSLKDFAQRKALDMGLEFVDVNHQSRITSTFSWNRRSVGQWVKSIAESGFVITHSFHGLALCLLYHKPFVIIYDNGNKISRFVSLLQIVGLENRLFTSIESAAQSEVWNESIDYQSVDSKLAELRECSLSFLNRITQK